MVGAREATPLLFQFGLHDTAPTEILQGCRDRKVVDDRILAASYAVERRHRVDAKREGEPRGDLPSDFRSRRMGDMNMCLPGCEYTEYDHKGAQPFQSGQQRLCKAARQCSEANDTISQRSGIQAAEDRDASFNHRGPFNFHRRPCVYDETQEILEDRRV